MPYGYYPFYWGDEQYFYSGGLYYQNDDNQYTVVEPPLGAEINSVPDDAQPITIDGQQYYELNGVYYQPMTNDDGTVGYVIAGKDGQLSTDNAAPAVNGNFAGGNVGNAVQAPQVGDIYDQLPQDSRKIRLNGEIFYVSPDDYYYQATIGTNGGTVYKIIGTPDDGFGN